MKRPLARLVSAGCVALLCATGGAIPASSAQALGGEGGCSQETSAPHQEVGTLDLTATLALSTHNEERTRLGVPPLAWDCELASDASRWAYELARRGTLEHADPAIRKGSGENLWMGTAGRFPVEHMFGRFIDEGRLYRHGQFPDISVTGNWADAGHYSQVIWRGTRELGCALAQGEGKDVLVCRYHPAGNVRGRTPY